MSYHIYNTRGLVLSQQTTGEADKICNILTRDFGLVRARAIGARKSLSKLSGHIEPVSLSSISLVKGKEQWRLTSAELIKKIKKTKALDLLEKLIVGETPHTELFEAVEKHLEADEITLVAQILYHLGYLKKTDLELPQGALVKAINEGLKHSHLT